MRPEIVLLEKPEALAVAAAEIFTRLCQASIAMRGRFAVALAGGTTPRMTYEKLAGLSRTDGPDWSRVDLFVGDERDVPPDHEQSNYHMMREALFDTVLDDPDRVGRFHTEWQDPERTARAYAEEARRRLPADRAGRPRFDLVLLGLGTDAHTASLFPRSPLLPDSPGFAAHVFVPGLDTRRYTLTPAAINAAADVLFLVAGSSKSAALRAVLDEEGPVETAPARVVRPAHGRLRWLVDRAAAAGSSAAGH